MDAFFRELSDEHRIIKTAIHPNRWTLFSATYTLNWVYAPFDPSSRNVISRNPGVYCFHIGYVNKGLPDVGYALYVGITTRPLRTRYGEYLREKDDPEGRFPVRKFLNVFVNELTFAYAPVDPSSVDLDRLELDLGGALMPPYSRKDLPARIKQRRSAWP
jgi:hypothetical protein